METFKIGDIIILKPYETQTKARLIAYGIKEPYIITGIDDEYLNINNTNSGWFMTRFEKCKIQIKTITIF